MEDDKPGPGFGAIGRTNLEHFVGMGDLEESKRAIAEGRSTGFLTADEWDRFFRLEERAKRRKRKPTPVVLIIHGGIEYRLTTADLALLDSVANRLGNVPVFHADASGAASDAARWACGRGMATRAFSANWKRHHHVAGYVRNQNMCDAAGDGSVLIAFPGEQETADMVRRAAMAGFETVEAASHREPADGFDGLRVVGGSSQRDVADARGLFDA